MYGHGLGGPFGWIVGVFAAIVWAIGTIILIAIIVALIVLLVRYLWFGTKASRRYLELNGQPAMRMRSTTTAAPAATAAPTKAAPAGSTATKPVSKPSMPPKA